MDAGDFIESSKVLIQTVSRSLTQFDSSIPPPRNTLSSSVHRTNATTVVVGGIKLDTESKSKGNFKDWSLYEDEERAEEG